MADGEGPDAGPATLRAAWSELTGNTLRKTFPQLLIGVWFWRLVLERHGLALSRPDVFITVPISTVVVFYAIVFIRVLGVLPRRYPAFYVYQALLFIGYTLWLGFTVPAHRRDTREWIGWAAMASGLTACVILVVPSMTVSG